MTRSPRVLLSRILRAYRSARIRLGQPAAPIVTVPGTPPADDPAPGEATGFDGARAFDLLRLQCAQGPRIPGTPGHTATRDLLLRELSRWADEVAVQEWRQPVARGPGAGRTFPMTNLFALLRGTADRDTPAERIRPELMVCAHWDTRPVADQDPDPAKRSHPVPGANDGASGAAVVLELGRALRARRPAGSVAFALWDGEDLGEYYYGSRLYSGVCGRPGYARWRPRRAVLLDMVGKKGLRCTTETHSILYAPRLWDEVHRAADRLGLDRHFHGPVRGIMDDHVFLNRAGIPSVVLIDYAYPHWHTTGDTVDECAPESLQAVGDVLLRFVEDA